MPFSLKPELIKLIEGKYIYLEDNKNYAEEEFTVFFDKSKEHYHYRAEIVSRLKNGDLNKTIVTANSDRHFIFTAAQVSRTTAQKKSEEIYIMDEHNGLINYTFKINGEVHKSERPWAQKHHLSLPSAMLSTYFLLNKKVESTRATPITLITSVNEFSFEGPLEEKLLWGLWQSIENHEFDLNGSNVMASDFELYMNDPNARDIEIPVKFKISKHFYIPYVIEGIDQTKIVIDHLKRYEIQETIKI
jgi:hypothetical protein